MHTGDPSETQPRGYYEHRIEISIYIGGEAVYFNKKVIDVKKQPAINDLLNQIIDLMDTPGDRVLLKSPDNNWLPVKEISDTEPREHLERVCNVSQSGGDTWTLQFGGLAWNVENIPAPGLYCARHNSQDCGCVEAIKAYRLDPTPFTEVVDYATK
jgi:hypothetical protein